MAASVSRMPWRGRASARVVLFSMMIVGALGTGLGGTDASVTPDPARLELLPPVPVTSTTTTTTVPLDVDPPAPPPLAMPAALTPAEAGAAINRAMDELLPGRPPLPPDVAVFRAQVAPGTDLDAMARAFIANRYANLIAHRSRPRAAAVGSPPCQVVVGPSAWSEPAHRLPLECP